MSNELQALLDRVASTDPATAKALRRHVDSLQSRRQFGLNFERHTPESVALTGRAISVGDKVRFLPERGTAAAESEATWLVTALSGPKGAKVAELLDPKTNDEASRAVDDLVFVADFRDPIYPGLALCGERLLRGGDKPFHTVINGENFHVLEALEFTSQGSVDCIYIDPPYNTGTSDWIYNDKHVDPTDAYIHSKWLAFMERRLMLAKRLLKPTGVVIVAIGDDEHHRLRMLMDQVFGEVNFISDVVWQGGRKNDPRFVSNGADYMLVYAKEKAIWSVEGIPVKEAPDVHTLTADKIPAAGARWRVPKPGVEEVLSQGRTAWEESDGNEVEATKLMRAWFRSQPKDSPAKAMSRSVYFLPDGRLCRDTDITWPGGGGPDYDVLHPVTREPVPVPERGWLYSSPERMQEMIDDGWVIFREDHTKPISLKKPLESVTGQAALSVFDRQRTHGSRVLYEPKNGTGVFKDKRFPNPKDPEVLAEWIGLCTPKDAVVLDFFGGSGSTADAVMRLNRLGGRRRVILVTNNELSDADSKSLRKKGLRPGDPEWEANGVFQHVCRPRITTVVTGLRNDGSQYSEGLEENVEFFDLTYENPALVELDMAYERIAPLLWMRAGAQGRLIAERSDTFDIADYYAVLFSVDSAGPFLQEVAHAEDLRIAYVVTDDATQFQAIAGQLPDGVESVRLYESYLRTFEINNGRA
ncbi:MAG: site-specific DNA-methyltransferase [Gordonia sp. (in: high G+C Gram-positive bacteria)]|uniref:site-specific DNA-methyltransferase n=1 Tax=Gordonia sp. (in: high G+C Gram-positive bacteria) TaxID=84139 RepID=UPI003C793ACC